MSERPDMSQTPYHRIIREERNFAAVVYHYLLIEDNLKAFLACVNEEKFKNTNLENAEVYFEFAYLRDWWHKLKEDDEKELAIDSLLGKNNFPAKEVLDNIVGKVHWEKSIYNVFTGSEKKRIKSATGSPAKWQMNPLVDQFQKAIHSSRVTKEDAQELFFRMCMLKWAFNAKPDLVIALRNNKNSDKKIIHTIVIEAKMESRYDKYPSDDKDLFTKVLGAYDDSRYLSRSKDGKKLFVTQFALQKYLFDELLGMVDKATYVQLLKKCKKDCECNSEGKADGSIVRTWEQVFDLFPAMEAAGSLNNFIGDIKKRVHKLAGHKNNG